MLRQEPHTLEFFSDYHLASNSVTKNNNNKDYNLLLYNNKDYNKDYNYNQRKHQKSLYILLIVTNLKVTVMTERK